MFLGLPDPDTLVRGMDPASDPSIIKQNSKKNLDSYYFVTLFFLSLKNDLKGLSHEIDFKNFDKNLQNLAYLRDAAGF
jgi:hypothetical protein